MRDKVFATFARVMGLEPEGLTGAESPDSVPAWDSFRHMNLVMALEEDLGVLLDDEDVVAMTSLDAAVAVVAGRCGAAA
jgi:acyl carrier protein